MGGNVYDYYGIPNPAGVDREGPPSPPASSPSAMTQYKVVPPQGEQPTSMQPAPPPAPEPRPVTEIQRMINYGQGLEPERPEPAPTAPPPDASWDTGEAPRGLNLIRQAVTDIGNVPASEYAKAARNAAASVVRYGSGAVQLPAAIPQAVGIPAYSAIGAGSEGLAQLIESGEITSPGSVALAAAVPPAATAATKLGAGALRKVAPRLPGAAEQIQKWATEKMRGIYTNPRLQPKVPAKTLYKQVEKLNPKITIPQANPIRQAAHDLQLEQLRVGEGRLQNKQILGAADHVLKKLEDYWDPVKKVSEVPFQDLRAMQDVIRNEVDAIAGKASNTVTNAYRYLEKSIEDQIDAAITAGTATGAKASAAKGGSALELLRRARAAERREKSIVDLADVIEKGIAKRTTDMAESVRPGRPAEILREKMRVEKNYLRESFSRPEIREIEGVLDQVKSLPQLPAPTGQTTGSSIANPRLFKQTGAGAMIGGGVARYLGNDPWAGAAIGAATGAIAGDMASNIMASAVATEPGRRMVLAMLRANGGHFTEANMRMLGQFVRDQTAGAPRPLSDEPINAPIKSTPMGASPLPR